MMNEKAKEMGEKAKSWRFWLRGLIDSIVIGGGTSLVGTPALDITGVAEMSVNSALVVFLSGAVVNVLKFWVQHPLTSLNFVIVAFTLFLAGCETTGGTMAKRSALYHAGDRIATEVIDRHAGNREVVLVVAGTLRTAVGGKEISYGTVEVWYQDRKDELKLSEYDKQIVDAIIVPFWEELKAKHPGKILVIADPEIRADVKAFELGLRSALNS